MFFRRKKKIAIETNKLESKFVFLDIGLDELVDNLRSLSGVDLEQKKSVLAKRIRLLCEQELVGSFNELSNKIKYNNELLQKVMNLVTVNETYFYRELPQLQEALIQAKTLHKPIKILSAPCASGEEVYSLAILAQSLGFGDRDLTILGIDINSQVIKEAQYGVYSSRSLHKLDDDLKAKYFKEIDNKYYIKKEKFTNIKFDVVNIFDSNFLRLGKFDIIFSRNMMIYFDNEYKLLAIKRFYELLNSGGYLYTGHADLVPENNYFEKVMKNRLYYFKKIHTIL